MTSPIEATFAVGSRIGRYFSLISALPSALFIFYTAALLWAGALTNHFRLADIVPAVRDIAWQDLLWLIVLSVLLGIVVHPLQFALTQVLEGYWGAGRLGIRLAVGAVLRHRERALDLEQLAEAAKDSLLEEMLVRLPEKERERAALIGRSAAERLLNRRSGTPLAPTYVVFQAAQRARDAYPTAIRRVMPTRLGNVLRRHEDETGRQYGLSVIQISPHLSLGADPVHWEYVRDERQQMDLSIRMCLLALLAAAETAVLLVDNGFWVSLALAPYFVAYLSYLGAVAAARAYGVASATVLDMNRFRLYEQLHLPLPADSVAEYAAGQSLSRLLAKERPNKTATDPLRLVYEHRQPSGQDVDPKDQAQAAAEAAKSEPKTADNAAEDVDVAHEST